MKVYDGMDLEYLVKADRIKENITIRKRSQCYDFAYVIKANGLILDSIYFSPSCQRVKTKVKSSPA